MRTTTLTRAGRKWLDSMVSWYQTPPPFPSTAQLFKEVLTYDPTGQITSQRYQHTTNGAVTQSYSYDSVQRLIGWGNGGLDSAEYQYDDIGNRRWMGEHHTGVVTDNAYSYLGIGPNQMTRSRAFNSYGNAVTKDYWYNADGAVTAIDRNDTVQIPPPPPPQIGPTIRSWQDTLTYSWRGLLRRYTHQEGTFGELRDWRYRYSAGGEREQKRLYVARDSTHTAIGNNSWVYYLLGGSKEQLAVYHGQEGSHPECSVAEWRAYFYPVEYNAFGVAYTGVKEDLAQVSIKPTGSGWQKEYKVIDHVGSTRVGMLASGTFDMHDYDPFGRELSGAAVRQGFNGREEDRENGLFNLGVRKYDADNGGFPSIDPLWEKSRGWSPYVYANDNPVRVTDPSGMQGVTEKEFNGGGGGAGGGDGESLSLGEIWERIESNSSGSKSAAEAESNAEGVVGGEAALGPISDAQSYRTSAEAEADMETHSSQVPQKTYQTYTKRNPETDEVYTGRTSGKGAPDQNVANRDARHHMNAKGFAPAELDVSSTNKSAIRGREQQLIDVFGGAKSTGGTSGNAINGVSPKNPNALEYMLQAMREFGTPHK